MSVTEAGSTINLAVVLLLDLLIFFLVSLVLDLQLLTRLVQHVFQPLVRRRLALLAPGILAYWKLTTEAAKLRDDNP